MFTGKQRVRRNTSTADVIAEFLRISRIFPKAAHGDATSASISAVSVYALGTVMVLGIPIPVFARHQSARGNARREWVSG